jgi:hypothetical protein
LGIGRRADDLVAKSKEVKNGSNLAETSEEGCGSKRAVLPVVMMIVCGGIYFK